MKELSSIQNKHLLKPTFDDSHNEEQQMDELTQEITKVLQILALEDMLVWFPD